MRATGLTFSLSWLQGKFGAKVSFVSLELLVVRMINRAHLISNPDIFLCFVLDP